VLFVFIYMSSFQSFVLISIPVETGVVIRSVRRASALWCQLNVVHVVLHA
jgi:hypothetical protein